MMGYSDSDWASNDLALKSERLRIVLIALPFLAAVVWLFILRRRVLCMALACLLCAVMIFFIDLRLLPIVRYRRWLGEIFSGLKRSTAGYLMAIGEEEVYEEGVVFHEVTLNIYQDRSPEGERRFLLDAQKSLPTEWLGRILEVQSHESFLLEAHLRGETDA